MSFQSQALWRERKCLFSVDDFKLDFMLVVQSLSHVLLFVTPWTTALPGFPVLHHLLELARTYVLPVGDVIQPSRPLSSPFPPAFSLSSIRVVSTLHIRWPKCIVASASVSVLPVNIQD